MPWRTPKRQPASKLLLAPSLVAEDMANKGQHASSLQDKATSFGKASSLPWVNGSELNKFFTFEQTARSYGQLYKKLNRALLPCTQECGAKGFDVRACGRWGSIPLHACMCVLAHMCWS